MNTDTDTDTDLVNDAALMLDTIRHANSPTFRLGAAQSLRYLAEQMITSMESAASDPIDDEPEPEPIIDLAMKWQTRGGRKVVDLKITSGVIYPVFGYVDGLYTSWTLAGKYRLDGTESSIDLIPATEDTP